MSCLDQMKDDRKIRVLAIDDHALLLEGIASVLRSQSDIDLVAEASDGITGIEAFRVHKPDVTLLDLQLPDMSGIDAMRAIIGEFPAARVVILTTFRRDVQISAALRAGAYGFLLKDTLRTDLRETIRAVHAGSRVVPATVAVELAHHVADQSLSAREVEVLKGVARGNSNKMIGRELRISETTVKSHLKSILQKLDAQDRAHAVAVAARRGFIDL
ncbi:MAG TPA: response regulator transcription factor [Steroidobacter sp.]|uniref:response regulator transcription factor n=1 Tax=Steroidobacter sp. TaxID=1978227 RepID=UPI002EDB9CC5